MTPKKAPHFSLYDDQKNLVSLSDFEGKTVVLLFFPLAFTGVCTKELCSVRDEFGDYQALNAQVLGISVDSLFSLAQFKEAQQLNFPLLSDFNKEMSTAYNCLYADFVLGMKGVSKRAAFVLNKDGEIIYEEILEDAGQIPNFEKIKETLANQ
jgi:glutaredoxin-dependent peroxiredoxin